MFHRGEVVELEITDFAFGGRGIAKIPTEDGHYIVFVDNAFPGQLVKAKIDTKRKRHAEAKLLEILRRSDVEKVGEYQEISGGPYIFVPVEIQEEYKKKSTLEVFSRISGIRDLDAKFDEFISSPDHYFYRNKMEYSFSCIEHDLETNEEKDEAFALGFKRRGTWWKVESLNKPSGMFDEQWETVLKEVREYLFATGLPAWHPPKKEGFFRHIVVRKSFEQDQLLINMVTSSEGLEKFDEEKFAEFLVLKLGNRLAGFQHTINDNVADRAKIENGRWRLVYGEPKVIEKLLGLNFEISMESFFQTNPKSAEQLYNKALDYVFEENVPEGKVVMDLFCGTGTIGQIVSTRQANVEIVGVDIVEEAIEDAKRNAKRNGIEGIKFYAADVGKFLKEHPEYINTISTVILDPPRAGIAPKTLQKTIDLGAENIVYISCNPSTQARDTDALRQAGYELEKLSFVDQFPHTGHIESIAKFKRKAI
ncbi:MAG: 23S rRNA (uracil(1939)-C(5))-methyltransferase RlmD [Crocinitomicaceae bacterium]|nr:23S rRNA (uracil(1939)-C(5))-methyltransferase RlmD [Crocinitomicaceae bacterium]MDP4867070.1 23S rRNA (uracil(1939)-C(5))-methyltransferase RlmD [Crocinitomicaceae bacterium]MDP5010062.1 23S rRNA (uracil(1939)-C(5))-methyltransferase RlmD [Crocinitomicaceae bacterium]